jgi:hypothetical protein
MRFSTTQKYLAILVLAIALSAGGIAYAVHCSKNKDDAGRGGALAVALAFVVLFVSRGQGARVYDILAVEGPELLKKIDEPQAAKPEPGAGPALVPQDLLAAALAGKSPAEIKMDALLVKLRRDSDDQRIQNIYLAFTSVIGTLVWGLGDLIAKKFI